MSLVCKHDWKIQSKEIMPSAWEQMWQASNSANNPWTWLSEISISLFRKKCIIILQCEHCGKNKIIIETNP